jgi:O-acetyl-ADP-ribose deacetylase
MAVAELQVLQADVTRLEVDAIANAANTELRHGGGVAGAISRAGGPEVQRESHERAPIHLGEAVETTAGDMPARWVIHAATMELGGPTSAEIIERATRATLEKAEELGCRSLALVAFGTGVGGFPLEEAARLMVGAARAHDGGLERIVFAVHGDPAERAFGEALRAE